MKALELMLVPPADKNDAAFLQNPGLCRLSLLMRYMFFSKKVSAFVLLLTVLLMVACFDLR
jgi:hypothetical protein